MADIDNGSSIRSNEFAPLVVTACDFLPITPKDRLIGWAALTINDAFVVANIGVKILPNGSSVELRYPIKRLPTGKELQCLYPLTAQADRTLVAAVEAHLTELFGEDSDRAPSDHRLHQVGVPA